MLSQVELQTQIAERLYAADLYVPPADIDGVNVAAEEEHARRVLAEMGDDE